MIKYGFIRFDFPAPNGVTYRLSLAAFDDYLGIIQQWGQSGKTNTAFWSLAPLAYIEFTQSNLHTQYENERCLYFVDNEQAISRVTINSFLNAIDAYWGMRRDEAYLNTPAAQPMDSVGITFFNRDDGGLCGYVGMILLGEQGETAND